MEAGAGDKERSGQGSRWQCLVAQQQPENGHDARQSNREGLTSGIGGRERCCCMGLGVRRGCHAGPGGKRGRERQGADKWARVRFYI
jgi:hypothetical protein